MSKRWTPEEEEELRRRRAQGESIRSIAEAMGRGSSTVWHKSKALDLASPPKEMLALGVISTKGGVGKSTVSIGLAQGLARLGYQVGYLDLDLDSPCGHILAGADRPEDSDGMLRPSIVHKVRSLSIGASVDEGFPLDMDEARKGQVLASLFQSVDWQGVSILIMDMPPGVPAELRWFVSVGAKPQGVVVVTQPQKVATRSVQRVISYVRQMEIPVVGLVENMSGDVFGEGGGERLSALVDVPYIGTIPLDPEIREASDEGSIMPDGRFDGLVQSVMGWIKGRGSDAAVTETAHPGRPG